MKRFKQYLAEDMPEYQEGGGARNHTVSPKLPKTPSTKLGNIGPYEVHHYENATGLDDEMVSIQHRGKQVGQFTFYRVRNRPIRIDFPTMAAAHRGKKALVKNLVPKVYGMIADKFGTIESGEQQTKGGRSIWTRLSKMRPVKIGRSSELRGDQSAEYLSHPNHPNVRLNWEQHADYEDTYLELTDGGGWSTVGEAKRKLRKFGIDRKILAGMKTVKDLPHPDDFKRKTINLSRMGNYNPTKHDDIVYGEPYSESSRDITLRLHGRKKKRK